MLPMAMPRDPMAMPRDPMGIDAFAFYSVWLGLERLPERRHPGTASGTVAAQWEALAPQVALVPEVAQVLAYQ